MNAAAVVVYAAVADEMCVLVALKRACFCGNGWSILHNVTYSLYSFILRYQYHNVFIL